MATPTRVRSRMVDSIPSGTPTDTQFFRSLSIVLSKPGLSSAIASQHDELISSKQNMIDYNRISSSTLNRIPSMLVSLLHITPALSSGILISTLCVQQSINALRPMQR